VLGSDTNLLHQDLTWWISDTVAQKSRIHRQEQKETLWVGFSSLETRTTDLKNKPKDLVVNAPLELAFAQHMFSAFMWAVTQEIPRETLYAAKVVTGSFDVNKPETWSLLGLQNPGLTNMINEIRSTGLGSLKDIYLVVIPPLSCANKLLSDAVVDHVLQNVLPYEISCRWGVASRAYVNLLTISEERGSADIFVRRAVAAAIEFLFQVTAEPLVEDKDPLDFGGHGSGEYKAVTIGQVERACFTRCDCKTQNLLREARP